MKRLMRDCKANDIVKVACNLDEKIEHTFLVLTDGGYFQNNCNAYNLTTNQLAILDMNREVDHVTTMSELFKNR